MKHFYILCILLCLFILTSCNPSKSIDFTFDTSALPKEITKDNFNISDIILVVVDENGQTTRVALDPSMINDTDLAKLQTGGTHQISVTYQNVTKNLEISITRQQYKVTFLNRFGRILDEQYVYEGDNAVLPKYGEITGYTLVGYSSDDYLNVSKDCTIYPIYEKNIYTVKFIINGSIIEERQIEEGYQLNEFPEIPYLEGYVGVWDNVEGIEIMNDLTINATYREGNVYGLLDKTHNAIIETYGNKVITSSIDLITTLNDTKITWETNSKYLSNTGKLNRPYEKTELSISYKIELNGKSISSSLPVILEGYKDLTENIASGYVYRNYYSLTDQFFETMDIIYCAFILFNADGTLKSNASVLGSVQDYIMPKAKENGVYVVLSLGGGGSEPRDAYVAMTKNPESRKRMIDNIIALINEYGFDGVDIDWETPSSSQAPYFTTFVKELNAAIKKNNPHHLVTAAITGGRWQPPQYDLKNSGQYLDYINVMTYGMSSSSGNYQNALYTRNGYHNTSLKVGGGLSSCSIEESVTIFNNYGIPNNKLIFGLAFYGVRQYYSNGRWTSNGSISYTDIKNKYLNDSNYTYYYDEAAGVPYLISNDHTYFISFDDPRSIIEKCQFVKNNNCAGVMYWEYGCDTTGDLIQAIHDGLKK